MSSLRQKQMIEKEFWKNKVKYWLMSDPFIFAFSGNQGRPSESPEFVSHWKGAGLFHVWRGESLIPIPVTLYMDGWYYPFPHCCSAGSGVTDIGQQQWHALTICTFYKIPEVCKDRTKASAGANSLKNSRDKGGWERMESWCVSSSSQCYCRSKHWNT